MYQTGYPTSVGRRRSKNAERQAEIIKMHWSAVNEPREWAPQEIENCGTVVIKGDDAAKVPKKGGRPRKADK